MNRITRLLAVTSISGALALGAAGVAQANPDPVAQGGKAQISKVDRPSRDHNGGNDHNGKNHDHGGKDHGHDHNGKNHK